MKKENISFVSPLHILMEILKIEKIQPFSVVFLFVMWHITLSCMKIDPN